MSPITPLSAYRSCIRIRSGTWPLKQRWRDKHGISQIVVLEPKRPSEIVKILKDRGVAETTSYQQIRRGVDTGGIKQLVDGRIASIDYSLSRSEVELAILKIMERESVAGFFSDSSSVPGYGLERVAHELGKPPGDIESDFYFVMRKLRERATEVGNDKGRLFESLGRTQVS